MKIFKIILVVVLILITAGLATFVGFNWTSIKQGLSGKNLYTKENIQESYDKGFSEGIKKEEDYKNIVDELRSGLENEKQKVITITAESSEKQKQIENLTINVSNLTKNIETLNENVETLTNTKRENELEMTRLNARIVELQTQIDNLQGDKTANLAEIERLTKKYDDLFKNYMEQGTLNYQYQSTIAVQNSQIIEMNKNIIELNKQILANGILISQLQSKIKTLENDVEYYKQLLSAFQDENKLIVAFEYNERVYNVQAITKNTTVTVTTPTSTNYIKFNGWKIKGGTELINLPTYIITENTTFEANLTYYYDLKFYNGETVYNSQIIEKNTNPIEPAIPTNSGFTFKGWSLDKINVIDITTLQITENTNLHALFIKEPYNVVSTPIDITQNKIQGWGSESYKLKNINSAESHEKIKTININITFKFSNGYGEVFNYENIILTANKTIAENGSFSFRFVLGDNNGISCFFNNMFDGEADENSLYFSYFGNISNSDLNIMNLVINSLSFIYE